MFEKARNMSIYSFSEEPNIKIDDIKPRAISLAQKCKGQNIVTLKFGSVAIKLSAYFDDVYLVMYYNIFCEVDECGYKPKVDGRNVELKHLQWKKFVYANTEVGSLSDNLEQEMFTVLMLECKKHNLNWIENITFNEFEEKLSTIKNL